MGATHNIFYLRYLFFAVENFPPQREEVCMTSFVMGTLAFNHLIHSASDEMQKNIRLAGTAANAQIQESANRAKEIIEALGKEYQTALKESEAAAHRFAANAMIQIRDLIKEQDEAVQQLGSRLQLAATAMPLSDKTPRTTGKLAWNVYAVNPLQKIVLQIKGHFPQLNESDCMPILSRCCDELQADPSPPISPFLYGLDSLFFELNASQAFAESHIQSQDRTTAIVSQWMLNLPYKQGGIFSSIGTVTTPVRLRLLPKLPGKVSLIYHQIMPKARREKKEEMKIGSAKGNDNIPSNTFIPFKVVGGFNNDEPNGDSKGVDGCMGCGEWFFRMTPSEGYQFDITTLKPLTYRYAIGDPEPPRPVTINDPSQIVYGARTKHVSVGTSQEMAFTIACTEVEITPTIRETKEAKIMSWGESQNFTPGSDWKDGAWELHFTPFDQEERVVSSQIGDLGNYLRIESNGQSGFRIRVKKPEELD